MKIALYYIITITALSYYGVEVCPYLESLTIPSLAVNLIIFFVPVYILRHFLLIYWVKPSDIIVQSRRRLYLELSSFLFAGFSIAIYNMIAHSFPFGSGLKVILGSMAFGFFAAFDTVLEHERRIIQDFKHSSDWINQSRKFFSLPKKFTIVAISTGVLAAIIILLLIIHDFKWLSENVATVGVMQARNSVIFEILFVFSILFALSLKLVIAYSANLKVYFTNQTRILEQISNGELEQYVPVITNDEFGIIADHTNKMIDGLKEKNHIKNVFGKVISPAIAQRLLGQGNQSVESERKNLVFLFADIRNFTSLTEKTDPELLVQELNAYFTKMVSIIQKHHGVVDKYIGDGLLAVFGLEEETNPAQEAVSTAIGMQKEVHRSQFKIPVEIGIGIHQGDVIAGIIGSPDRHEFTFIGDAVNTSSRLEGATKTLNASIVISDVVYNKIERPHNLHRWIEYGDVSLKGKVRTIKTYGLEKSYFKSQKNAL